MAIPDVNRSRDWMLTVKVDWRLKDGLSLTVPCSYCNGKGKFGGFGYDEPEDCPKCYARGTQRNPGIEPKPELPVVFTKYIYQTARAYIKRLDAKRLKNSPEEVLVAKMGEE